MCTHICVIAYDKPHRKCSSVASTGNYQIDVTHNDVILDGSSTTVRAYDPGAVVVVHQISGGVVNKPVELTGKPRYRVTS